MAQILSFKNDYTGLDGEKAEEQLKMYGLNADTEDAPMSVAAMVVKPRVFLQLAAAVLMFITGQILGGCIMLLLTGAYIATEVYLALKLRERHESMKRLAGMKFRVVRDGELTFVRKEYLVPDDILVLQGGERVPADAYLLETDRLLMDESVFTGDKTPVEKAPGVDNSKQTPKKNCIYKDTLVLSGSLIARIYATGEDAARYQERPAHTVEFEKAARRVSFIMNIGALLMLIPAALFGIAKLPVDGFADGIIPAALAAVGFALCFAPAEICGIIRLYYYNCAARLNRKHALVKDLHVMESLGALTCLCVEKSGTITKDHLEVSGEFTENRPMFLNVSVLACEPAPQSQIEKAILLNAAFGGVDAGELQSNELLAQYPFSESAKVAGNLWQVGKGRLLCIKGSPETVLTLCDVDTEQLHFIQSKQHAFSSAGEQVLAVAYRMLKDGEEEPENLLETRYTYIGLMAFSSQTKDTVPYAVKCCYKAGVNVIMTTGDSESTALAIAKKIGLKPGRSITGETLRQCAQNGEKPDLEGVNVFARVTPAQRCEIVRMLQEKGEIVAMTGDGVEDIDVLKQADVGIVTNPAASPAAVESCDMLMSDDNLIATVDAIKESRQGHLNIKRAVGLIISGQVALALFALVNLLTGRELVVTPALAALLSVAIIPACALMFLDNLADIKSDFIPSGFLGKGKVGRVFLLRSLLQGCTLGMGIILFYFMSWGLDSPVMRPAFLFMFDIGLVLCGFTGLSGKRTFFEVFRERKSFFSLFISGVVVLLTLMLMYIPYLNGAFGMDMLNILVMLIALLLTLLFNGWPEAAKLIRRRQ